MEVEGREAITSATSQFGRIPCFGRNKRAAGFANQSLESPKTLLDSHRLSADTTLARFHVLSMLALASPSPPVLEHASSGRGQRFRRNQGLWTREPQGEL